MLRSSIRNRWGYHKAQLISEFSLSLCRPSLYRQCSGRYSSCSCKIQNPSRNCLGTTIDLTVQIWTCLFEMGQCRLWLILVYIWFWRSRRNEHWCLFPSSQVVLCRLLVGQCHDLHELSLRICGSYLFHIIRLQYLLLLSFYFTLFLYNSVGIL